MVEEILKLESYRSKDYKKALEEVFLKIDELMLHHIRVNGHTGRSRFDDFTADPNDYSEAGCTSNVILITENKIYCANAGDSRAVMCKGRETVELSHDHKPDN